MSNRLGIGIIGCGDISTEYLEAMPRFGVLDVRAVASRRLETAQAKGAQFGVPATSVEELLADPSIDLVVNLTTPRAHLDIGLRVLESGKHLYAEKPLGVTFAEGKTLLAAARARGLRVGSAPESFLGGANQQARELIDAGVAGSIIGGTAFFAAPGHEYWHPNPQFYYDIGGGPMLDMGPYHITELVNLLGPVARVQALSLTPHRERVIRSEPRRGQMMPVKVDTHVVGTLVFASGALIQITMSFDVPKHVHLRTQIFGSEASVLISGPNQPSNVVRVGRPESEWEDVPVTLPYVQSSRSVGIADMAHAILSGRPHRASGELALHVLEVMEGFATASREERIVDINTKVERPAPISQSLTEGHIS